MLITIDQPHDGFASYGRPVYEPIMRKHDAADSVTWMLPAWYRYERFGVVPDGPPIDVSDYAPPLVEDASRPRPTSTTDACASPELRTVARWIMDTGCGTDLISQDDADRCVPETFHQGKSLAFNTAGGPAKTRLRAYMRVAEIEQTIPVSVLPHTPAVLTIGRRCMHEGYSFIWPDGKAPYLIRPDGIIVPLVVHQDIPYLEPQSLERRPVQEGFQKLATKKSPKQRWG